MSTSLTVRHRLSRTSAKRLRSASMRLLGDAQRVWISLSDGLYHLFLTARSRMLGKRLIHVIGDSHARSFRRSGFVVHHIGPATAYNLCKENSSTRAGAKLFSLAQHIRRSRGIIVLTFGEIDCRIHIYYQYCKQGHCRSLEELIDRTVEAYGTALNRLAEQGVTFFVCGVTPTARQDNRYGYPAYGSPEIRSHITRSFNTRLRAFCRDHDYPFLDIYSATSDDRGFIAREYDADGVHLNRKLAGLVTTLLGEEWNQRP